MAIIKLGTVVTGIRGTVGGSVFSANASGAYVKQWKMPTNPRTQKQNAQQTFLSSLPGEYRALSFAQQLAWATWAAQPAQAQTNSLGETYYLHAFQWFVKWNTWRHTNGQNIRQDAPTQTQPAAPTLTAYTVESSPPLAEISYPGGTFSSSQFIVVFADIWPTRSSYFRHPNPRFLKAQLNPGAGPFDFTSEFEATLGTPIVGQSSIATVYRQSSQGYRSAPTNIYGPINT